MVMGEYTQETEVLVIGAGPGGYAAAFRAADLGLEVTMVDPEPKPGGECLFRGCIPSKALLHLSELLHDTRKAESMGIRFGQPEIDPERIRGWKDSVVQELADGLVTLCKKRGVQLIKGRAMFEGSGSVRLLDSEISHITFGHAILATGSYPTPLPDIPFEGRIVDSAGALELPDIPERLFIYGGGYVALELGTVYAMLGSEVTLAVRSERLLRGADEDLTRPLIRRLEEIFRGGIHFHTNIKSAKDKGEKVEVRFEGDIEKKEQRFDRVLIAVGRTPNSNDIGLENTKVRLDRKGYVIADEQQRTHDGKILAVGDLVGGIMLAHKAFQEGKVAAEVIAGKPSAFDVRAIPAVVYTDPQIAWCGLTEEEARRKGRAVMVERFPWKFSGRAKTMEAQDGLTKILLDPESERVLGLGIVGRDAEGLVSEGTLAVEMGALAEDVGLTIHPHPTLSETLGEAAEVFTGTATHIIPKKRSE